MGWSRGKYDPSTLYDLFYSGANHGELIAFIGANPLQGHWGDGSFFPQSTGYWAIGSSRQFTSDKSGELWLGFNDDAVGKATSDNAGAVTALITVATKATLSAFASANPTSGDAPLSVQFAGSASGGSGSYTYYWVFGDGSTNSNLQDPSHIYQSAGSHTATLYVTDSTSNQATSTVTVTVSTSPPSTYSVTINAHGNTEGIDVNVPITMDGSPSGHSTPYTFQGLTGAHSFEVPDTDPAGYPFAYWDTSNSGARNSKITLIGPGDETHTAYYEQYFYGPQNVKATPNISEIDLTWDQLTIPGYTVEEYYIYRGTTPNFTPSWLHPHGICGASATQFQDKIQDDNIYYYRVAANFQQCLSAASTPVGCARLESVKGIESTITGVTSLSVPSLSYYSFQQNFYLFTGKKDSQGNPIVYWCQNCVDEMQNWNPIGRCYEITFIFSYNWNTGQASNLQRSPKISLFMKKVPDTLYFNASITDGSLSMINSIGSASWNSLDLTSDAFICTTGNPYGSPYTIDFPNLDVVAGGVWYLPTPADVTFNSGSGYVSGETEVGGQWIPARDHYLVQDDSSTGTKEMSTGLQWNDLISNAQFYSQDGAHDWKGVFFEPDFSAQATQETLFETLGTPMKTLVFSADCPVYLDLFDNQGNCVGYNVSSGTVDLEVDNVVWVSNQTLLVFDPSGSYRLEVTGTDNGTYELETSWQDVTGTTITLLDSNSTITENETQVYDVGAKADVVPMNILSSKTVVGQGFGMPVNVTITDLGGPSVTCDVTLSANDTPIGTQSALNMSGWNSTTASFAWNTTGVAYGNYSLCAYATNNNSTGGTVTVTIPGDINGDFKVSLADLVLLANAYGSHPSDTKWNPNADINGNGVVDLSDLVLLANHYGQHYP